MVASQTLRTLKLSLLADVSGFGKELDKAGTSFGKFTDGLGKAAGIATGVIAGIGGIAVAAIQAASDLEETGTALDQIYGEEGAKRLQEFSRTAARTIGQSRQQALSAAQTFGVFGRSAGLAGDELVDFSTEFVTLAADLASFNNTSVDQAITALGAALRGESEPIRNYGVLLDAATLQQRAFAEGLIETEKEALSPQVRTLAAYAEILGQTKVQQGDFSRTSEGLANSQRIFTASIEDFRAELGEQLLPVVQELLPKIRGFVDTLLDADPETIVKLGTSIFQLAAAIVALNTALKVFAGLQAAARFLFTTGGGILIALAAGGSAEVRPLAESRELNQRYYELQAAEERRSGLSFNPNSSFTGRRPFVERQPIIVNGIVGSPYQVFREIERAQAVGDRTRLGAR